MCDCGQEPIQASRDQRRGACGVQTQRRLTLCRAQVMAGAGALQVLVHECFSHTGARHNKQLQNMAEISIEFSWIRSYWTIMLAMVQGMAHSLRLQIVLTGYTD